MTIATDAIDTTPRTPTPVGAAQALAAVIEPLFGGRMPVRIRAWDGSETGPIDAPVAIIRSRQALRRLLFHPNELGLAQAYVLGELDVEGDLRAGLRSVWKNARARQGDHSGPPRTRAIRPCHQDCQGPWSSWTTTSFARIPGEGGR